MGAETFHSSHKMHHPEIDLTGPDSAKGVWALDDVVVDTQWNITIRGASFYDDEYVKRDGRWLHQAHVVPARLRRAPAARQRRRPVAHRVVVGDRRQSKLPAG